MTREFLITTLLERGIHAEPIEEVNNGIVSEGVRLGNNDICPCFFEGCYKSIAESDVDMLIEKLLLACTDTSHFLVENLQSWDYSKTRLMLCLQQKSIEDICKRDFLDLEMYVRIVVDVDDSDVNATVKVTKELLDYYKIDEDTLFETARQCTEKLICIKTMREILKDYGVPEEEIDEVMLFAAPLTAITNASKNYGASSIIFTETLKSIATDYNSDLVIIPSSLHECLVLPVDDNTDVEEFNYMIADINDTQLLPEEVLSNHYYLYIRDVNKLFTSRQEYEDFLDKEHREWRYKGDLTCEIDTWFDMLEANQISEEELYHTLLDKGITVNMIREFAGDEKADILQKFCKEN